MTDKQQTYFYTALHERDVADIRMRYKVVDVECLDLNLINLKIFKDDFFNKYPEKKNIINEMLSHYLNNYDNNIYKKTDYLCNEKEKICICNLNATNFRNMYLSENNISNTKYISWCKKKINN